MPAGRKKKVIPTEIIDDKSTEEEAEISQPEENGDASTEVEEMQEENGDASPEEKPVKKGRGRPKKVDGDTSTKKAKPEKKIPIKRSERERKTIVYDDGGESFDEDEPVKKSPKKKAGKPKPPKVVAKAGRGRPPTKVKPGRGRPKKAVAELNGDASSSGEEEAVEDVKDQPPKKWGRPRKDGSTDIRPKLPKKTTKFNRKRHTPNYFAAYQAKMRAQKENL